MIHARGKYEESDIRSRVYVHWMPLRGYVLSNGCMSDVNYKSDSGVSLPKADQRFDERQSFPPQESGIRRFQVSAVQVHASQSSARQGFELLRFSTSPTGQKGCQLIVARYPPFAIENAAKASRVAPALHNKKTRRLRGSPMVENNQVWECDTIDLD